MRMQVLAARSSAWAAAVADAAELIDGPAFEPLKQSARTVAGFAVVNGIRIFLKRVNEGSWLKGWVLRLRGSRARRVLQGAAILKTAGFACPEPLAAAEARSLGAIRASYVISEALDDARIMSDVVLAGGRRTFRRRRQILAAVAVEIRRLHDAGVYTLDLQETNLMLMEEGDTWTIHFVDLEDFRRVRSVSEQRRLLNLVHLDRTMGRYVPRTQRLRFFYKYLGGRPNRDEARRVLRNFFTLRAHAQRRAAAHGRPGKAKALSKDRPPNLAIALIAAVFLASQLLMPLAAHAQSDGISQSSDNPRFQGWRHASLGACSYKSAGTTCSF
jgi:tRNA A-37 threonylcarbamoyl transferase component Bud32